MATISLLGILPLAMGNLELANSSTNPCYHHIDAAYDCSMYYQLSNLFCLCPGQQATICSASSTRTYKTTANQRKYRSLFDRHSYKDSETSKRAGPMPLTIPVQQEVARETLDTPIPKELGLPSLKGGMLGS